MVKPQLAKKTFSLYVYPSFSSFILPLCGLVKILITQRCHNIRCALHELSFAPVIDTLHKNKLKLNFWVPYLLAMPLFFFLSYQATAQIVNIEDKRSQFKDSIQWVEQLELGANLTRNKSDVFSLNGKAQIEFTYHNKLLISITNFNFIKAGEENFINEGFQHLRYNSKINSWLTFELFGQVQYNERANIALRALGGTGFRYRLFEKEGDKAFLGTSYMYEFEEESEVVIKHINHRLNTYFSLAWHPQVNIKIASTSYFQPLFDNLKDYRLSSQTAIIFAFSKRLDFKTTFSIIYDSRAATGAPKTTYRFLNSLRYRF